MRRVRRPVSASCPDRTGEVRQLLDDPPPSDASSAKVIKWGQRIRAALECPRGDADGACEDCIRRELALYAIVSSVDYDASAWHRFRKLTAERDRDTDRDVVELRSRR